MFNLMSNFLGSHHLQARDFFIVDYCYYKPPLLVALINPLVALFIVLGRKDKHIV